MKIGNLLNVISQPVQLWFAKQSAKDQKMLSILSIFLVICALGLSLLTLHQRAEKSANELRSEKNLLTWVTTQYPNLDMNNHSNQNLADTIQTMASSSGLTITTSEQGDATQITTSHQSFAVLGNFLNILAQQGISLNTLNIQQQQDGILLLQATLSR